LARSKKPRRPKSRQDLTANAAKILPGKQKSQRPKSRWEPAANAAEILPVKQKSGGQNPAEIVWQTSARFS